MILAAANQYGVPPQVALGVASHESRFQPTAQAPNSSAAGIYQLISATQNTLGVSNPYDAQQNINAGVGLLAHYYQVYGNWNDALQAFSDGPATVGISPPSSQTQGLVDYVNAYGPGVSLDASGTTPGDSIPTDSGASVSDALGLTQYGVTDTMLAVGAAVFAGAMLWALA